MQINQIKFTQDDNGAKPAEVNVTITIEEAIWIAEIAGNQRGSSPHKSIYYALVGDVFNRYWDDGVDEAQRIYGVEIPPIKYDD